MNVWERLLRCFGGEEPAVTEEERRYRDVVKRKQHTLAQRLGAMERMHLTDELRQHTHREEP